MPNDPFYQSKDWWNLRSKVKAQWKREGKPCAMCKQPIDWNKRPIADHIEPRSKRPDLEYRFLMILSSWRRVRKLLTLSAGDIPPIA